MRNFALLMWKNTHHQNNSLKLTYKKYLKTSVTNVKKQDVSNLIDIVLSDLEKISLLMINFIQKAKLKV